MVKFQIIGTLSIVGILISSSSICLQIRFLVGECFYHAAPEEAEEKVQERKLSLILNLVC